MIGRSETATLRPYIDFHGTVRPLLSIEVNRRCARPEWQVTTSNAWLARSLRGFTAKPHTPLDPFKDSQDTPRFKTEQQAEPSG
jgi:hypothetical protein